MWRKYFILKNYVPGKVIVHGFGELDFSGDVPVETCKKLYENDWPNLDITPEGEKVLYGIKPQVVTKSKGAKTKRIQKERN
jgi:hypothetical protein